MKTKSFIALLLTLSFLSACAQASPTTANPPPVSVLATPTTAYPLPGSVSATPTAGSYPEPSTQPTEVNSNAAQQAAIQEVSQKYNIPVDQVKVVSTEPMTWNSGCMGVVIPGVLCTNVIVNGFIVRLEANGQQFEMHANQDGTSVIDAAQLEATLRFVIRSNAQSIQVVNPNIPLGPTYNPAFNGFLSMGGSTSGKAYVYDSNQSKAIAVDANGQQVLSFIEGPTYGLALWRGGPGAQPRLAWGTQASGTDMSTSLMIANIDGTNLETLLTIGPQTTQAIQLVAELWSADGQSLYFSKEPVGLGGYILFGGASNLFKIDIASKQVTEIIPQAPSTGPQTCLDAISGDYRFIADHCVQGMITIRDLQTGTTTTLQPASDFTGYSVMGDARFSPAGDRVAFALAKHNPDNEQGWVAVGSSKGGTAELILTSDPGNYYNIMGWLDDQTLLVQSISIGSPNGANQVLTVSADGTTVTKVADGTFLTVIDNR